MDPDPIGSLALSTKVRKDRVLAANSDILATFEQPAPIKHDTGSPSATVHSRVLSSKVLATEVTSAINKLRHFLDPQLLDKLESPTTEHKETERLSKKLKIEPKKAKTELKASESKQELEDDGWESGSIHDEMVGIELEPKRIHKSSGESDQESNDELDASSSEDSSDNDLDISHTKLKPSKPSKSTTQSTFLPSLSVGFIRGDSDSDWSDGDDDPNDKHGGRKNRRGQRARRALVFISSSQNIYLTHLRDRIWEKKFGKGANHTKKQQAEDEARKAQQPDPSWSRSTTHTNTNFTPIKARPTPEHTGTSAAISRPPVRPATAVTIEDRPLHPSWEAKRRLKEKQAGVVPAQGTKIKF